MGESPLAAYLRSLGLALPQPTDSFSAMRASLPEGSPPPKIGPAPWYERVQNTVQEALDLPSWTPELPEGSYGLPPSIGAPTPGQGMQEDLLGVLAALFSQPAVRTLLEPQTDVAEALGGIPNYEPGGGPDKMTSMGMAAVRKTAQTGADRVIRDFAARMFETGGNARKAWKLVDVSDIPAAKLDDVVRRANEQFVQLVNSADPKMFNMDMQRRLVESGIANKDWYVKSKRGMTHVMGGDELTPPITSLASSQDTPYGNTSKMLGVRAGVGAGMRPAAAIEEFGGLANVKTGLRRLFGLEPGDPFNQRKTSDFLENLRGNFNPFVTDTWEGRGMGYGVQDFLTPAKTSSGKVKTGLWVDWPRSSQANAGQIVRPLQQGFGIPGAAQTDLIEDVVGATIGREFGLDPAATQASHWAGIQQFFGDKTAPYTKRPFDEQILARFNKWGITPKGPGEQFSVDEWAEILNQMRFDKAMTEIGRNRKYR